MRELLYIPNGRYVRFNGFNNLEAFLEIWFLDDVFREGRYDVIGAMVDKLFCGEVYTSFGMNRIDTFLRSEFEIIDT